MGRRTYLCFIGGLISGIVTLFVGTRQLNAQTVNLTDPTRVISGEELQRAGVVRLIDLLDDIAEVRILTLDGFTRLFSLNGTSSMHESAPKVVVDGHPIRFGHFATSDLDLLGLPVDIIDRVEIYARPSLISGVFAGEGAVHIFTKQADDGAELHGSVMVGVEDADPGHLDFQGGERSRKWFNGPDVELSGAGKVLGGWALGAVVHRRHAHADRVGRRPLTGVLAPSAIYTLANQRVHLSVVTLGAWADRFAYLPYASRVLATDHQGAALSASASHRISERGFLRHRVTVERSRVRYGPPPELWRDGAFVFSSALARTLDERIVVLGGTAELRRVQLGTASEDVRWASVFAAIAGRLTPGAHYRGGGMVAMDGRSIAVKAYGGITLARWEKHRADLYIAVVDALLHEQNAADLWAREELTPPLYPAEVTRPHGDVALRATFDAEWRWQPGTFHELRIGAGIRRSERVYLPSPMLRPAAGGGLRESVEFSYTDGTLAVFWGEFTTHILPGRQRIFWNWQRSIAGNDRYATAWDTMADVRLGVSITTPIIAGVQMRGGVMRESGTRWHEFDVAPAVESDLGGSTRVDMYVSKRLLSGRMNASAGVRNVLGAEVKVHPLGDTFGRSIRVEIGFDLVRR